MQYNNNNCFIFENYIVTFFQKKKITEFEICFFNGICLEVKAMQAGDIFDDDPDTTNFVDKVMHFKESLLIPYVKYNRNCRDFLKQLCHK